MWNVVLVEQPAEDILPVQSLSFPQRHQDPGRAYRLSGLECKVRLPQSAQNVAFIFPDSQLRPPGSRPSDTDYQGRGHPVSPH